MMSQIAYAAHKLRSWLVVSLVIPWMAGCDSTVQSQMVPSPKVKQSTEANSTESKEDKAVPAIDDPTAEKTEIATLGAGCFWCVEAVYQQLEGVVTVESGYAGGHVVNPTYDEVCGKQTGHAEVCQIRFDPSKITFEELLEVFWKTHDPTTKDRQGNDIGPQYRSVVFYHSEPQREAAEKWKKALNDAKAFKAPIVTEISPYTNFYKAEDYHQNYFRLNPNQGYCRIVVRPKVDKVREVFASKLKKTDDQ